MPIHRPLAPVPTEPATTPVNTTPHLGAGEGPRATDRFDAANPQTRFADPNLSGGVLPLPGGNHRIRSLEMEIQGLEEQARTVHGAALSGTMERLSQLRQALASLQRHEALTARRDRLVAQIAGLYPQPHDDLVLFRLDYSHLNGREPDPWRYPSRESIENLHVVRTYRALSASSNPEDRRIAATVRGLFEDMRNHRGVFRTNGADPQTTETAEAASREFEAVLNHPHLQAFLQRVAAAERQALTSNEGARTRLAATESLQAFRQFPGLVNALVHYDALVGATRTPADQRTLLLDTSRFLIRRAEAYLATIPEREREPIRTALAGLRDLESSLDRMQGATLTREALSSAAGRMKDIVQSFLPLEERTLRGAFSRMLGQLERLPSPEDNIRPIRRALGAVETLPSPTDRLAAYQRIAQMIDAASVVRLVDARIHVLRQQLSAVQMNHTVARIGLSLDDSPHAGDYVADFREAAHEDEARWTRMIAAYQAVRARVASANPDEAARGRRELQQLEGSTMLGSLAQSAETAQLMNQLTIGAGIILVAALTAEFGGLALAAGAESLLAGTALTAATQEFLVGAVFYTSMTGIFTAVSRELNERAFGPQANTHSFFTDLLTNTAMFGFVGGAMRGMGRLVNSYVERVALRNLGRAGGLVPAGTTETETMSRFAMDQISRAAVDREMARLMDGFGARLARGGVLLGTEYAAFNIFEMARTTVELTARGETDPLGRAAASVLSPSGQARIGAFLLAMRTLNTVVEPFVAPVRERLGNLIGEGLLNARMAELRRDVARLSEDFAEGRVASPLEMATRSRALLEQRQRILMEARARETQPTQDIEREFAANERALRQLDLMTDFLGGVNRIFSETNAFGIRPFSQDGAVFTYRPGQAQTIVDALAGLPGGLDRTNLRIHPNGLIEVPFLPSPFLPQPRTIFLFPSSLAPRSAVGGGIVVRRT